MHQDYIYEYQTNGNALMAPEYRAQRTHQPEKEILTVSDYRCASMIRSGHMLISHHVRSVLVDPIRK